MWHRRSDGGTESGTTIGMRFTSDTIKKTLSSNNDVEYYDLIEYCKSKFIYSKISD